jgi:hypothetical protein
VSKISESQYMDDLIDMDEVEEEEEQRAVPAL